MGSFWTNLLLRTVDTDRVRQAVKDMRLIPAYLCQASSGWCSTYPEATETQDQALLERSLSNLTRVLSCAGIATLMHDSDEFIYILASAGKIIDLYDSAPGMLSGEDAPPRGGDARLLIRTLELNVPRVKVETILRGGESGDARKKKDSFVEKLELEMLRKFRSHGMNEEEAGRLVRQRFSEMKDELQELEDAASRDSRSGTVRPDADEVARELEGVLGLSPGELQSGFRYAAAGEGPEELVLLS